MWQAAGRAWNRLLSHTHHQASREDESTITYTSILLIAKYCTTAVPEVARVKCPSKAFPLLRVLFALFLCVDSVTAESYGLMYFRYVLILNIIYSNPSVCLNTLLVHVSYFHFFFCCPWNLCFTWITWSSLVWSWHWSSTRPVCAKLASL